MVVCFLGLQLSLVSFHRGFSRDCSPFTFGLVGSLQLQSTSSYFLEIRHSRRFPEGGSGGYSAKLEMISCHYQLKISQKDSTDLNYTFHFLQFNPSALS